MRNLISSSTVTLVGSETAVVRTVPGPVQRQHLVSNGGFNRDQADDFGVDLELVQCHIRNVVELAQDLGDRLVRDEVQIDQDVGQLSAVFLLVPDRGVELFKL